MDKLKNIEYLIKNEENKDFNEFRNVKEILNSDFGEQIK